MGISAGGSKGGPKGDINVTPLVDVVLVLLIIFMVSMPIMLRQITIEIPEKATEEQISTITPINIVGKADGSVELDDGGDKQSVNRIDLAKTLKPMIDKKTSERVVFVDFEDAMVYSDVVSIMDTVKGMGKDASGNFSNPVRVALKVREPGAPGAAPAAPAAP